MDYRDLQANKNKWYDYFDELRMVATIDELKIDDELKEDVEVACCFEVCGTCRGRGSHVNPSIDSHGITGDEWDNDWSYEDRENYMSGMYDVICYECNGKRIVPVPDKYTNTPTIIRAIENKEEEEYYNARERVTEWEMGY